MAILYEFDRNADGKLDVHEFTRLLRRLRKHVEVTTAAPSEAALLRSAFRSFDLSGGGTISAASLRPALIRANVDTTSRLASAVFRDLDGRGVAELSLAEFQNIAHALSAAAVHSAAAAGMQCIKYKV